MTHEHSYLALGDSYTIGEQVPIEESFPYQTADLLRRNHFVTIAHPTIIATTGWTTSELNAGIDAAPPSPGYDLVSLLIGVNNQYRDMDVITYKNEFALLLNRAILFAAGRPQHVFVLSIPDWGVTPFAEGKDSAKIAGAINQYNSVNRAIALAYKCHYLDITADTRQLGNNPEYLTPDQLHYAGKTYAGWAHKLAPLMAEVIKPKSAG